MHPLSSVVPFEEARARLAAGVGPVGRRVAVPVGQCAGRVLAGPVRAREDAPAGDRSRMDGYAVSTADLGPDGGAVRRVQGQALANASGLAPLEAGACFEVATGALLPPGADAVVPVEDTQPGPEPGTVRFGDPPTPGAHVSARGSDYRAGDPLVPAGVLVTPARAAAIAAAGAAEVEAFDRPRVLVVPTGDEIVTSAGPLPPGHVRDSNSVGLAALVASRGGVAERHAPVADDPAALEAALAEASAFDAAVFTGGTSAGVKDHLAAVLGRAGSVSFHGVAIRPGKPVLFGHAGDVPVLGLPGNPTSCMLGAHLFLAPLVDRLTGTRGQVRTWAPTPLGEDVSGFVRASPPTFRTFVLVRIAGGKALPVVKDSMSVTGSSQADGYFTVGPGAPTPGVGEKVNVFTFA